jgi:hypothetical protein
VSRLIRNGHLGLGLVGVSSMNYLAFHCLLSISTLCSPGPVRAGTLHQVELVSRSFPIRVAGWLVAENIEFIIFNNLPSRPLTNSLYHLVARRPSSLDLLPYFKYHTYIWKSASTPHLENTWRYSYRKSAPRQDCSDIYRAR